MILSGGPVTPVTSTARDKSAKSKARGNPCRMPAT
jgi:hypothetical protein